MKNISPWKAMLAMAVIFALAAEFFQHIAKRSPEEQVAFAQEKVFEREARMHQSLETIATFSTDSQYHEYFIHSGINPRFSFFVFEKGRLVQWSNNEIALPENTGSGKIADMSVLHLPNGIFEAFEKNVGDEIWSVYLVNLYDQKIEGVLVSSKGYGNRNGEEVKTSTLRHFIGAIEANDYAKIELIIKDVFGLSNEYWISFYLGKDMYDKKYIFVPESITEENFTNIPEQDKKYCGG